MCDILNSTLRHYIEYARAHMVPCAGCKRGVRTYAPDDWDTIQLLAKLSYEESYYDRRTKGGTD